MTKQLLTLWCASFLSLTALGVTTYGDCQQGCKKNVQCFKVGSSNNVCLLVPQMDEPLFIALTIDSQTWTTGGQPVTLYNTCPNQALECSAIRGFIQIATCPAANQCVLVGNQDRYTCTVE